MSVCDTVVRGQAICMGAYGSWHAAAFPAANKDRKRLD
jgi:hypothetical protein